MGFFKKYNGTSNVRLVRIERTIWALIYGGLLAIVLGMFVDQGQGDGADMLYLGGGVAVAIGIAMIYMRSRMREEN
jgi:hypothetical protein